MSIPSTLLSYTIFQIKETRKNGSVQLLSRVRLFATPWVTSRQASLSITNSQSLPKLMSIESVMPSSHLILCRPLLLPPLIFPSIRIHVYLRLSLFTVHLKLSKHCELAIPQCKILLVFKRKKKKWGFPGEIQGWDRESKDKCGTVLGA